MIDTSDVIETGCPQFSAHSERTDRVVNDERQTLFEPQSSPLTLLQLKTHDFRVSSETRSSAVARAFDQRPDLPGVLVCEDEELLGVVSRAQFQEQLSHPFGVELFLQRPIFDLLDQLDSDLLVLPAACGIAEATRFALERVPRAVYEPIAVDNGGCFSLLDIHTLLLAQTRLLADANETIQQQKEEAEAANRAKSQFLANMSHEIRTPLTAILGFAENLLESGITASERSSAAETIHRNGEHLLHLINDILDLSKIEAGKLDVELIPVSPVALIAEIMSVMRVRADAKQLPLVLKYLSAMPDKVRTDPTRLRQILINLIGNAIKFTAEGRVELHVECIQSSGPGDVARLRLSIIDTGIGLSDDHRQKLFQPFMQGDGSTTRRFGGTGLGLSISRRLARMLGGDVTVSSQLGRGSTFVVVLQTGLLSHAIWCPEPSEAITSLTCRELISPGRDIHLPCRILLAEDSPDNQRLISALLKKSGAEVVLANNGETAVSLVWQEFRHGHPFDVVLMDMQMPVLDGYSATKKLRSMGYMEPIVALTANAMRGDRQQCLDAGCDDYATKPIQRLELLRTIASFLPERKQDLETNSEVAVDQLSNSEASITVDVALVLTNKTQALEWLNGDHKLFAEIVQLVCDQLPMIRSELNGALDAREGPKLRRIAHTMKSSADNIGAVPCATVAKEVEQLAKDERWDELPTAVINLQADINYLETALITWIVQEERAARGREPSRY
ncbi:MAG: ATP-binding protein [Planctomycetia bacterium]|nr:ATP-binding protein [Planctomycetia bacterium]